MCAANHGSICDSSRGGWAYDYFWLCAGAYSSDWSLAVAGTSARLILTHDPCVWLKSINGAASEARQQSALTLRVFVIAIQAACCFILSGLNFCPRFQMARVTADNCLAMVKRARLGSIP